MVTSGQERRVYRDLQHAWALRCSRTHDQLRHRCRPQACFRPKPCWPGNETFHLAIGAHHADVLLVTRAFSEHAQVQQGPLPLAKIDNDIRVVQYVGPPFGVGFIDVVVVLPARGKHPHRVAPDDEAHQIEKMATLFHQGAARVALEPVPVTYLGQKRVTVFADRQHRGATG